MFYFYLTEELSDSEIYRFHLYCLNKYAHIFDKMTFILSLNDTNNIELIRKWENKLLRLHTKGTIEFEIHKNDEFKESASFKEHVSDKLGENELVFFGHGKGVTNIEKYSKEQIYMWIAGMYFYNLNFMDEVEESLVNKKYMSYGSFLCKNQEYKDFRYTKYQWYYIGTFFWINSGKIKNYITANEIELPLLCERFYDEDFLGNIYDCWPTRNAYSHNGTFLRNAHDFYRYTNDYINMLYDDRSDFDDFLKEINENI